MLVCPALLVPAAATSDDHVTDTQFDMFVTSLGNMLNSIYNAIVSVKDTIFDRMSHVYTNILYVKDAVLSLADRIAPSGTNLAGYITSVSDTLVNFRTWFITQFDIKLSSLKTAIESKLDSVIQKLDLLFNGENGAADDFNNQVSTEATEFDENMDIIQDVTRPIIEDIDLDVDKEIPDGEVVKVGQLLGIFFQNQYIYIVFFVAFTFSLVSYGIFGKR